MKKLNNGCKAVTHWLQSITAKLILGVLLLAGVSFAIGYVFSGKLAPKDDQWYITEYSDNSGNQAMFYTIFNEAKGSLILIDGGWKENTEHVRSVIKEHGNHVSAWIITHYHNDHVDAFNNIMENPGKIRVDAIYDSPMDYEHYLSIAREWDAPDSFTKYREVTKDNENIHHIQRDETIEIDGLRFEFFNSYDSLTNEIQDVPNCASLIFKVSGAAENMLFTADCGTPEIADIVIQRYGDRLQADYYQAPHHGNSMNWHEMVQTVSPKCIFLDGPQWLMEEEKYTAKDLIAYCEEHGITYYNYETAPNTIVLK